MKVAIVGGGIFGVTIATVLAKNDCKVDLYEKEPDIFTHASGINQYRLHRGYHYPRSTETILTCLRGEPEFAEMYGDAVLDDEIEHYYCIAKEGSKISGEDCKKIFDRFSLEHEEMDSGVVNKDKISFSTKVKEFLFDPVALKKICWNNLNQSGVNVLLNTKALPENLKDYDLVVVATYCDNNSWLHDSPSSKKPYQYEVCEKLVLKLPEKFSKKSVVILDGAFMCIDPFGRTGYHAMGNVVHAIHDRQIANSVEIEAKYKQVLNKGVIKNPSLTNYNNFIESAVEYFPGIEKAEHEGSMFTIRTVLPFRDHDDARPTVVEQIRNNLVTVFSGKIPTCVDAAYQVLNIVKFRKEGR
ncbi:MAG: FAD-binding oxidoreductase [Nanoarchaeota archaeon]|nr:FAD-binding oxidoreductase [Nanoarchaeota archaeon]MBU1051167.1 FAD-binding oxidoreductase [Nanoarchaeota archaeon]MBU1988924.1 FAD-binding oxidoreductase [Nanoarchaeota archaeon]